MRNSVGFDWNPLDQTLWFTDNGRDMMGDDVPDDELNHVTRARPSTSAIRIATQGDVPDPEFGTGRPCSEFVAPAARLGAHVAALGMRFYTGHDVPRRSTAATSSSPSTARGTGAARSATASCASRSTATARSRAHEPFVCRLAAAGDGGAESVWGRPVDVLVLPDGSLLISDDHAGAIYRVRYAR